MENDGPRYPSAGPMLPVDAKGPVHPGGRLLPPRPASATAKQAPPLGWGAAVVLLVIVGVFIASAASKSGMLGSANPTGAVSPTAYRSAVQGQVTEMEAATNEMATITAGTSIPAAVSILSDAQERLAHVDGEAHGLTPPTCFANIHREYLAAVDLLYTSTTDALRGARQSDISLVSQGVDEIQQANAKFAAIAPEIRAVTC